MERSSPVFFVLLEAWTAKKHYRLAQSISIKCFNTFVQSAVNARRQG